MKKLLMLFMIAVVLIGCSNFENKKSKIVTAEEILNAVETDNIVLLNNFFAADISVNYMDKDGKSLLIVALENDSQKALEMLLGRGAYIEEIFEDEKTPIFYVRSLNALKQMLEVGADINKKSNDGKTLLSYFIETKPLSYSKYLIENGADINIIEEDGWTPVFRAAAKNDATLVESMKNNKGNFIKLDLDGNYPIYYAHNEEVLLKLLDGIKYDLSTENKKEENILGEIYLRAVSYDYISVIEKLLEMGVNPNYMSYGDSALSIAKDYKNESMIKYLNSKGIK